MNALPSKERRWTISVRPPIPEFKRLIMFFNLVVIILSLSLSVKARIIGTGCESIPLSSESSSIYVTCKGNFSEMDNLKRHLENISDPVTVFELQDALLDVLPSDIFHDVPNPAVRKVIFANVSMELLEIPELGDPPLESIKDTVESFEIYDSPKVFAWDFKSLKFKNLRNFIIQDSDLISITIPLFFWPELQFIQFQNSSIKWIHPIVFQKNKNLVICSLAHNRISSITRSMFPKPAAKLYSLDLSFNRLEFFPDDMFTDMDTLSELKLDQNRLKIISMELLKPVWNNLIQLWLDENEVPCRLLCWMTDEIELPIFLESSKCKISGKFMFIDLYLEQCKNPPSKL